VEQLRMI